MKIEEKKSTSEVIAARTAQASPRPARPAGEAAPPARPTDTATILGVPAGELTPGVRAALQTLLAEVDRLRRELDQSRQRISHLERLADEDTLVPLANRRAFVRELSRMMSFAERYDSYGAVIYFDVNHLKTINDRHGHAAGDAALKHISEILLAHVRTSDLVGRLGGDEFGVALAQTDRDAALVKANSLAAAIADSKLEWNGVPLKLSVSWGIHPFRGADHADSALAAADRAMYDQKRGAAPASKP